MIDQSLSPFILEKMAPNEKTEFDKLSVEIIVGALTELSKSSK
jgi:hypothetical protein